MYYECFLMMGCFGVVATYIYLFCKECELDQREAELDARERSLDERIQREKA